MSDLTPEERDLIEAEVLQQIKSVRLVFELGFPADLVAKAKSVVDSAGIFVVRNEKIRYPACFICRESCQRSPWQKLLDLR